MLFGEYADPFTGKHTAKTFFQIGLPDDVTLTDDARFDSLTLILALNHYHYGDTTLPLLMQVHELADAINYTYNDQLFNTSAIAEKTTFLGQFTGRINPNKDDSIHITLSAEKGRELFYKMLEKSGDISTADAFLTYFKGLSIGTGSGTAAVFGFNFSAGAVIMRMHYHTTIPYPEKKYKDFSINTSGIHFIQLLNDFKGTLLKDNIGEDGLIPTSLTNGIAYTQTNAGILLKVNFPSLRNVLQLSATVKLLRATLVMRSGETGYDPGKYPLASQLLLAETNATNIAGNYVYASDGYALAAYPVFDPVYGELPVYSFDVTSSISSLLTAENSSANGFFLTELLPGTGRGLNRAVFNDGTHGSQSSKLVLSLLTLKQ